VIKKLLTLLLSSIGLILAGAAIFAREIGIDHNVEWGAKRIFLLIVGLGIFLVGVFIEMILSWMGRYQIPKKVQANPLYIILRKLIKEYPVVIPPIGIVLIVYIWFAGAGSWTTWPERTDYYILLARAFQKQELHLPVEPSEKLLALADPYDPSQRIGVGEPLDFSLYRGKFYLYWGPVPALLLVPVSPDILRNISDITLVFGFSCALFLLLTYLIVVIWDRHFSFLPEWILAMSILLAGLSGPTAWMLGEGEIYEAAILGGQFFLVAGFVPALFLNGSTSDKIKLSLTGTLWALAIGTRLTLIVPIGVMMAMLVWRVWRHHSYRLTDIIQRLLFLGLPILIGFGLLAWYNHARFGSVSETGFTYQLAGTHIQRHLHEVISYRYVIQNFYNYLLAPIRFSSTFPFLVTNPGSIQPVLPFYELPGFYNAFFITGLIYSFPFMFFTLFLLKNRRRASIPERIEDQKSADLTWAVRTLSGSTLSALLFLFVFFWSAMRYIADFFPTLLLISLIGYFRGYIWAKEKGRQRDMAILGISVAALSVCISTALAISEFIL
jgi:hypothetical protein